MTERDSRENQTQAQTTPSGGTSEKSTAPYNDILALREVAARRGDAAIAGHTGDEQGARNYLEDPEPSVRATAFAALVRLGRADPSDIKNALEDEDPTVRRAACEHGVQLLGANFIPLLDDEVDSVVEAAAYALGEVGDRHAVDRLCDIARSHADPLCRESATAALGAIGDPAAKQTILSVLEDLPPIRRRAVIALAAFSGDDITEALKGRLVDRDWQVRQAAEDVLGFSAEEQH